MFRSSLVCLREETFALACFCDESQMATSLMMYLLPIYKSALGCHEITME